MTKREIQDQYGRIVGYEIDYGNGEVERTNKYGSVVSRTVDYDKKFAEVDRQINDFDHKYNTGVSDGPGLRPWLFSLVVWIIVPLIFLFTKQWLNAFNSFLGLGMLYYFSKLIDACNTAIMRWIIRIILILGYISLLVDILSGYGIYI